MTCVLHSPAKPFGALCHLLVELNDLFTFDPEANLINRFPMPEKLLFSFNIKDIIETVTQNTIWVLSDQNAITFLLLQKSFRCSNQLNMSSIALTEKVQPWIKISRLQFFPMTWLAYTLGSVINRSVSHQWDLSIYLLGYLVIFLIELCSIYANEYYDFKSDVANRNYSPFTGGSRVLVEGKLRDSEVTKAIRVLLVLIIAAGYLLANSVGMDSLFSVYSMVAVGLFLGLGYTMPPLKFCYRGVGELVVGSTHSFYVILCGFIFQGGSWSNPLPWVLGLPLFFAILAGIFLAGIPDREADYAAGKKTFAVLTDSRSATLAAIGSVVLSLLGALLLFINKVIDLSLIYWALLILSHALIFIYALWKLLQSNLYDRRIDGVMIISLTYIIWFGLLPFISFFIRP